MNWILLELKIGEIFAFDFRSPYYTNFRRYSSLSRIIEYILVPTERDGNTHQHNNEIYSPPILSAY